MLLHGFPMYRVWWQPLFEYWNELLLSSIDAPSTSPMHVVACDLRGYSDGASPDDIEQYTYNVFAEDIFAIAESVFGVGVSFHLMGHDHGAALAWYSAAMDVNDRLESLVTLSVPHICLMSEALCGNHTDEDQVVASNYFNQFSLADSATLNDAALTAMFQSFGLPVASPEQFQKLLWWYHGSLASAISMPRVVSDQEVQAFAEKFGPEMAFFVQNTRQAIPMEERECVPGIYEKEELTIKISTLFIFGLNDFALLCNNPYATEFDPVLIPEYEHITSFVLPDLLVGPTMTEAPSITSTEVTSVASNIVQNPAILVGSMVFAFPVAKDVVLF
ncbi:alpha/beta fold family hydrolase [Nitzschia inconspicua]|uniref:Alpha/beta fold family hydrolase n=1 Tax=Nitzschia inconspicua TaxID=303405 RepID=A0A9K3LQP4_9STRA|nr:alpha/beta fold family hydrolase [Nitzschia inconspicua]